MSLGPAEILVILVVALLVLGPSKLPEAARQVGKAMAEFRRVTSGFQAEMRDAFQEPVAPPSAGPSIEPLVESGHVPPPLPPADAVPPLQVPEALAPVAPPEETPPAYPGPQLPPDPPAH